MDHGLSFVLRGQKHWGRGRPVGADDPPVNFFTDLAARNVPVTPTPSTFSKVLPYRWEAYCRTNGRCTAVQMGGVLLGFLFLKA